MSNEIKILIAANLQVLGSLSFSFLRVKHYD